ncbi:MAG TPA: helix-turn-helix domain-containing protein [Candidatus Angelobacter sp.]|jgi:transcriptional regulator GlxA family with amidase domain|nr:helix-turn-helix domain-containing protein [Candidatus Angelobacter sp.]
MLRDVAVLAFHHAPVFEIGVVCEVFGLDRSADGLPRFDFALCAGEPPPLRTSSGFVVDTPHGLERLATADLIVVPGWRVDSPTPPPEAALQALRDAHQRGARIVSVCSGAFVLAAAGLLDGRRATTHWRYAATLAQRHPRIELTPDVLYVDEGSVLTSAGTAAGIDLCLHIVRTEFGADVANRIARRMVIPPHREGGQAQYVETPVPDGARDDALGDTLSWALAHLDGDISVQVLARRAHMSPRTFVRRFAASFGGTPHQWLLAQRITQARRLLETTDVSIDEVARRAGFGSAAALRLHFARRLATSPLAYRRTFRSASSVSA